MTYGVWAWLIGWIKWWILGVIAMAVAGLVVWGLWPSAKMSGPRQRRYVAYTACLLTDSQGLAGSDAVVVWAGMQEASAATLVKVQYLSVPADAQGAASATFVLNSLMQQGCGQVFAAGVGPAAAVRSGAGSFDKVRFYVLGGAVGGVGNVTVISRGSDADVKQYVDKAIVAAAHG